MLYNHPLPLPAPCFYASILTFFNIVLKTFLLLLSLIIGTSIPTSCFTLLCCNALHFVATCGDGATSWNISLDLCTILGVENILNIKGGEYSLTQDVWGPL